MTKTEYTANVAAALTTYPRISLVSNEWAHLAVDEIIDSLIESIKFFFKDESNFIVITTNNISFNLHDYKAIEMSHFFNKPLDFIDAIEIAIVNHLMKTDED